MPPAALIEEECVPREGGSSRTFKLFSRAEVAKHNKPEDCWLVISEKVYNVTPWLKHHPGGDLVLTSFAGVDVTDAFLNTHAVSETAAKRMNCFCIGSVTSETDTFDPLEKDQRLLAEKLLKEGYYETDFFWYGMTLLRIMLLLPLSIACVLHGNWWIEVLGSMIMALFFQQLAFLGHDAGHNGISHVLKYDSWFGFVVGDLLTGISIGWWKDTHNTHHVLTNSVDYDPDIQHLPIFAVTDKLFGSLYSYYHKRVMAFDKISRFLIQYQHYFFFPVMAFARFNLYVQSFLFVFLKADAALRRKELVCLAIFWGWFGWVLTQCQSPFVFLIISHIFAGILHVQICISHFAMETYVGHTYSDKNESFFRRQLATTMNLNANGWTHWFYGGLEFQIEHHLFPQLPRHNLAKVKPMVQELCAKYDIPYHSVGLVRALQLTVAALKDVAVKAGSAGCEKSQNPWTMLWQGLNAYG